MNTNTKFTACMVNNSDKETVIAIRNEFNLTEKEAMTMIIRAALDNRQGLEELVSELKECQNAIKMAKKAEKLELQLAALKKK